MKTPEQMSFLDTLFRDVREEGNEAERIVAEADDDRERLLLQIKAAHVLSLLGAFPEAAEWETNLDAVYEFCRQEQGLTPEDVRDYASTVKRMRREISELEAA